MAKCTIISKSEEQKPEGKRAVIYARYSSSKQNEMSIDQQIAECMAFIKFKNYEFVCSYIDKAKSASHNVEKRTDFLQMLEDSKNDMFDVVVAYAVDRISRDEGGAFYEYENRLNENGVRIEYSSQHFGDKDEDEAYALIKSIYVSQASMFVTKLRRDTVRGMSANAQEGLYSGGGSIPMGYKLTDGDTRGKRKAYVLDKERAPFVKEAFKMYLNGKSTKAIADYLTDKGFRTIHGNSITHDNINRMLSNPIYKGTKVTHFDNKRLKDTTYIVEDACEAIITEDDWDRVQIEKIKRSHSGKTEAHRETYILRGKLFCGTCGSEMVANKGKQYHYYSCKERKGRKGNDPKRCSKQNIGKQALEDTIMQIITEMVWNEESISFYVKAAKKAESMRTINPNIKELKNSIAKHKAKKIKAMNLYLETDDEDWKDVANEEARLIKNEEATLKALNKIEANTMTADEFEKQIKEIYKVWNKLCVTAEGRMAILDNFIDKIYIYDPEDPEDPNKVKIKLSIKNNIECNLTDEITVEIDFSQLENDDSRVTTSIRYRTRYEDKGKVFLGVIFYRSIKMKNQQTVQIELPAFFISVKIINRNQLSFIHYFTNSFFLVFNRNIKIFIFHFIIIFYLSLMKFELLKRSQLIIFLKLRSI